ncbi:secretoglobin family 1D member 2-like isoform X2 [Saccopteryx bilineata]|uniref:secretoglobin family 1D member 2-like isoform X2 n=1 Tax=Saccopteryx bilineata TaxID=59482 RepID=UPI00338FD4B0
MKPVLSVLLLTLAFCCYEANAGDVCPNVVTEVGGLFFIPTFIYKSSLQKYDAPAEAVEAKLTVKKCIDNISLWNRLRVLGALTRVLKECNS